MPVKAKISKLSAAETLVSLQDDEQPSGSTSDQNEPVMYIAEPLPELNPIPPEDPFGNYDLLCENCGYKLEFRYKKEKINSKDIILLKKYYQLTKYVSISLAFQL